MSPPASATDAISTAILDQNYGIKPKEYSVAPGNEARLAQFLTQKEIDAAIIRSVTIAQMQETKLRRLASIVDEWKKLTKGSGHGSDQIFAGTAHEFQASCCSEPSYRIAGATEGSLCGGVSRSVISTVHRRCAKYLFARSR